MAGAAIHESETTMQAEVEAERSRRRIVSPGATALSNPAHSWASSLAPLQAPPWPRDR